MQKINDHRDAMVNRKKSFIAIKGHVREGKNNGQINFKRFIDAACYSGKRSTTLSNSFTEFI